MSPPRKAPDPETERAVRLEKVRKNAGFQSLREFWVFLKEELPEGSRSYEAIRNYHYDRDAPVDYYIAIAKGFGVSLHWLLTGEGEMDIASAAIEDDVPVDPTAAKVANAMARIPAWKEARADYRTFIGYTFVELLRATHWDLETADEDLLAAVAIGLWDLEALTWSILNGEEPDETEERYALFALASQAAIRAAIPPRFSSEAAAKRCLVLLAELPGHVAGILKDYPEEMRPIPEVEG